VKLSSEMAGKVFTTFRPLPEDVLRRELSACGAQHAFERSPANADVHDAERIAG